MSEGVGVIDHDGTAIAVLGVHGAVGIQLFAGLQTDGLPLLSWKRKLEHAGEVLSEVHHIVAVFQGSDTDCIPFFDHPYGLVLLWA